MLRSNSVLRMRSAILFGAAACFVSSTIVAGPRFDSAYTDLAKDCRPAFDDIADDAELGEDMPLRCRGPSGASLYIYFSAISAFLQVDTKDRDGALAQPLQLSDHMRGKIEWRMADGAPFAVIVRVRKSEGRPETLEVRGIGQYRDLSASVAVAGNARANAKARALADRAGAARR